jgi:hypothetical protein
VRNTFPICGSSLQAAEWKRFLRMGHGILVPRGNVSATADAIAAFSRKSRDARQRAAARNRVLEEFTMGLAASEAKLSKA